MAGEKETKKKQVFCPYCDEEIFAAKFPFCQPCGVILRYCTKCETVVPKEAEVCPECGAEIPAEVT